MKVSIIIPVFQVEQYIERCINSVLRQTYRELEVILVDDCSPDKSMDIARSLILNSECKDIEFKFLRHDRNRGLSAARNTGIKAATGTYVYFLDSDDEITEDSIFVQVEPLKRFDYDIVTSYYEIKGVKEEFPKQDIIGELMGVEKICNAYYQNRWHCMAWNKLCRRTFLLKNELFFLEGLVHEDELWSALLACTAESMYVVPVPTYIYYIRENSITTTDNIAKKLFHYKMILKSFYEYQEAKNLYFEEMEDVEFRIRNYVIHLMTLQHYSPYRIYSEIRHCDIRSVKIKNKKYRSIKVKILNLDQYVPVAMGYVYKQMINRILMFL